MFTSKVNNQADNQQYQALPGNELEENSQSSKQIAKTETTNLVNIAQSLKKIFDANSVIREISDSDIEFFKNQYFDEKTKTQKFNNATLYKQATKFLQKKGIEKPSNEQISEFIVNLCSKINDQQIIFQHQSQVMCMAMSNDQKFIYTGSAKGQITRVNLMTSQIEEMIKIDCSGSSAITQLILSQDDKYLYSRQQDKVLKQWNTETLESKEIKIDGLSFTKSMALSHNDKYLYLAAKEGPLVKLDTETLESKQFGDTETIEEKQQEKTGNYFKCIVLSKNDEFIYSANKNNIIKKWNTETLQGEQMLGVAHTKRITCMVISNDGEFLFSGSMDHSVKKWDTQTLKCMDGKGHNKKVTCIQISEDDKFLYSGSEDKCVRKWNTETLQNEIMQGQQDDILTLCVSSDGKFVYIGTVKGIVKKFNTETNQNEENNGHKDAVNCLLLSKDNHIIYSGGDDKVLRKWEMYGSQPQQLFVEGCDYKKFVASSDSKYLYSIEYGEYILRKWNLETRECEEMAKVGYIYDIALTSDDQYLYSSSEGILRKWDTTTFDCQYIKYENEQPSQLQISNDDQFLYCIVSDHIYKYDTKTIKAKVQEVAEQVKDEIPQEDEDEIPQEDEDEIPQEDEDEDECCKKEIIPITGQQIEMEFEKMDCSGDQPSTLALSYDGKMLCSGNNYSSITIWNTENFNKKKIKNITDEIMDLKIDKANKYLYSAHYENFIMKWDLNTREGRKIEGHQGLVRSLALTNDDKYLYSASSDMTIRKWNTYSLFDEEISRYKNQPWSLTVSKDNRFLFTSCEYLPILQYKLMKEPLFKNFNNLANQTSQQAVKNKDVCTCTNPITQLEAKYLNLPELMLQYSYRDEQIMSVIKNYGYLKFNYAEEDQYNWVLYLAMKNKKMSLVNMIIQHYITNPTDYRIKFLDCEVETKILATNSPLIERFMSEVVRIKQTHPCKDQERGNIKNGRNQAQIEKGELSLNENCKPDNQIFNLLVDKTDQEDEILPELNFYLYGCSKPLSWGNKFLIKRLEQIQDLSPENLCLYSEEILNEWDKFSFIDKLRCCLMWTMTWTAYAYVNWFQHTYWLIIPVLLINLIFGLSELKIGLSMGMAYIGFFNLLDIYIFLMVPFLTATACHKNKDSRIVLINALTFIILNMRSIVYLRAFQGPRYLIAMILVVFKDIVPFALIMASFLAFFSQTDVYLGRLSKGTELNYWTVLSENYLASTGDWNLDNYQPARLLMFYIYTVILFVVFMNLIIAVIGDTYATFSAAQEEYDLRELTDLTIEYHYLFQSKKSTPEKWDYESEEMKQGGLKLLDTYQNNLSTPGVLSYKIQVVTMQNETLAKMRQMKCQLDQQMVALKSDVSEIQLNAKLNQTGLLHSQDQIEKKIEDNQQQIKSISSKMDKLIKLLMKDGNLNEEDTQVDPSMKNEEDKKVEPVDSDFKKISSSLVLNFKK